MTDDSKAFRKSNLGQLEIPSRHLTRGTQEIRAKIYRYRILLEEFLPISLKNIFSLSF
jgi:hypothetical protein